MEKSARNATWLVATLIFGCSADPGYQGRSSDDWIKDLRAPENRRRVEAADALGKILLINPGSHNVVDALSVAVTDTSDEVRLAAATALTSDGVDPSGALGGFHALLHDSAHAYVRQEMALLVGTLGVERGRMLMAPLSESLSDPDAGVRAAAVESLGMLGPATASQTNAIAKLASDADAGVRRAAIQSLLNLRAPADVTLRATRPALSDSSAPVRAAAAYALWQLGREAEPAIPELMIALNDESPSVRAAAAFALGGIGPAANRAKSALSRLLTDTAKSVASEAAVALAAIDGRQVKPKPYAEPTTQERCSLGSRAPGC